MICSALYFQLHTYSLPSWYLFFSWTKGGPWELLMLPPYLFSRRFPTALTLQKGKHVYSYMVIEVFGEEGLMIEGSQHPLLLVCTEIHSVTWMTFQINLTLL